MFERVRKVLAKEIGFKEDEITIESNLIQDLGIESMDLYSLLDSLEEEFQAKIPEVDGIETVGDIVNIVSKLKN